MTAACIDLGRDVVAIEMDSELCADIERRADRHEAAKTGRLHRVEMRKIEGPLFPRSELDHTATEKPHGLTTMRGGSTSDHPGRGADSIRS